MPSRLSSLGLLSLTLLLASWAPVLAQDGDAATAAGDTLTESDSTIRAMWDFQLTEVDGDPITVGKIVIGLALFVAGIFISRFLSRLLGGRLLARLGIDEDVQFALRTVLFYSLLLIFTLVAMHLVRVPLTIFTLLGGALAIGVGFGTQTLINNFISGWILITERPVGIGDLVEVEGVVGTIERVGARSTSMRRSDGIHMLIPNSLMLERTVVNWTLADNRVRTTLRIGVVYGSPTDQVRTLIRTIVNRNERVLPEPEPIVIFEDFGNDALNFDVYFWVNVKQEMDLRRAKSELRYAIDHAFRAAGIVIAFPQRDVHLDSNKPLEVRMVEEPPPPSAAESARSRKAMLGRVELFRSLNPDDLGELASAVDEREFEAKTAVVAQDGQSSSLYVVTRGLLEVTVRDETGERQVGQLIPGDFFGEMSLLTGNPATATVTAVTDSAAYKVSAEMLAPILKRRPEVVTALSEMMTARRDKIEGLGTGQTPRQSVKAEIVNRIQAFFRLG